MNEAEFEQRSRILVLETQRNEAFNKIVFLEGKIAVLQAKLQQCEQALLEQKSDGKRRRTKSRKDTGTN